MMKKQALSRNQIITALFFFAVMAAAAVLLYEVDSFRFSCRDAKGHCAFVNYALSGGNPFSDFSGKYIYIDYLSTEFDFAGFSSVPWALILGAVFYPGFLPFAYARIYILALHAVVLFICMLTIKKKAKPESFNLLMFLAAALGQYSFMYSLHFGNCGSIIGMLLIIAILIIDEKPVTAGLIMGLCLLKPQISAIFCLKWLMDKRFKSLICAASVSALGLALACIFIKESPVELIKQMGAASTDSSLQYLGLLSPLKFFNIKPMIIIAANAVIGCAYVIAGEIILRKEKFDDVFVYYIPCAAASTFWIYKNGTDFLVMIIATFALINIIKNIKSFAALIPVIILMGIFEMSRVFPSAAAEIFNDSALIRDAAKSAEGFVLALSGIAAVALIKKHTDKPQTSAS